MFIVRTIFAFTHVLQIPEVALFWYKTYSNSFVSEPQSKTPAIWVEHSGTRQFAVIGFCWRILRHFSQVHGCTWETS